MINFYVKGEKAKCKDSKDQLRAKKNIVSKIRSAKSKYTLLPENADDPTSFWKTLKFFFPVNSKLTGKIEINYNNIKKKTFSFNGFRP